MDTVMQTAGPIIERVQAEADKFEWVPGTTPLSSWQAPPIAVVSYLAVIGVLRLIMGPPLAPAKKKGDGKQTKKALTFINCLLAAHNLLLMVASAIMFVGCIFALWKRIIVSGMPAYDVLCDSSRSLTRGATFFWPYVFYLSKYYELLDTVFIVIKRRELLFLHVYHHCVTLCLAWVGMDNDASLLFVPLILNTFVHVLMYYQYAMTALGVDIWWKRYLTKIQMLQFLINVAGVVAWLAADTFVEKTAEGCAGEAWANWFCLIVQVSFYALFSQFSKARYAKPANKKE